MDHLIFSSSLVFPAAISSISLMRKPKIPNSTGPKISDVIVWMVVSDLFHNYSELLLGKKKIL